MLNDVPANGGINGDYKPNVTDDAVADALANVYGLILGWPMVDRGTERGEER